MYPYIHIFGLQYPTYSLVTVLGLITIGALGALIIRKRDIKFSDFLIVLVCALTALFIGAHLMHGISNINVFIRAAKDIGTKLTFWEYVKVVATGFSGLVYYGGFIGGYIGIVIYTKYSKTMKRGDILDVYAVLTPLFHTFGRVGCFLAGCCYGVESEFGFTTHDNTLNPGINDVNRLPIQLIEAGFNLLIFAVILILFYRSIAKSRLIYLYMLIYPPIRFTLEFFRGDTVRGFYFGLSTSQWVSIFLFIFGLIHFILKTKELRKEAQPTG